MPRPRVVPSTIATVALVAAALLLRAPHFGDPAYSIDEQFYLLVGDRLLHGALPYVDIWDRKPIGLFLIFAAARAAGGNGILAYQMLATLCAAATAFLIFRIARRCGIMAAAWAGLAYLVWIETVEGGGGQAPVFYNLPVAAAALLVLNAIENGRERRRCGFAAMALVGVGIQIKYTVVFEGLFFGLVLCALAFRHAPRRMAGAEAALMALTALAPTLLAFAFYAAIGQAKPFWFANFVSIFLRGATDPVELHRRLQVLVLQILPLAVCFGFGMASTTERRWRRFMLGWAAAAAAGVASLGVLYPHYLLPLFVPLSCGAAPIVARGIAGPLLAALVAWLPLGHLHYPDLATTLRSRRDIAELTALVPRRAVTRCLLMFDGPPILYVTSGACAASRFAFPDHLSAAMEARATGVDPAIALEEALRRRPAAITLSPIQLRAPNPRTYAILRAALASYRLAGAAQVAGRPIEVFVRR